MNRACLGTAWEVLVAGGDFTWDLACFAQLLVGGILRLVGSVARTVWWSNSAFLCLLCVGEDVGSVDCVCIGIVWLVGWLSKVGN